MNTHAQNIAFWLAANRLPEIGPVKFRRCLSHIPDMKTLFNASEKALQQTGLSAKDISLLQRPNWKAVETDLLWSQHSNHHILTLHDPRYPALLKEIYAPPLVLFVLGNLACLAKPQLAIVGTRRPTVSAYETAQQFARSLSEIGLVVTSGMALGIDAASHQGALEKGETIAVMGTGLNHIYPRSNRKLAENIITNGALISEFPPDEPPKAKNFPQRNRIISGLSAGVLIVEAAIKSGSLITARYAIEQGREVFAIPGSIYNPLSRGCHHLIRQGAKLVETPQDIIEELGPLLGVSQPSITPPQLELDIDLPSEVSKLYSKIGFETTSLDTIIVRSGLTSGEVSSILLSLELKGYVQTVPGGYVRTVFKLSKSGMNV